MILVNLYNKNFLRKNLFNNRNDYLDYNHNLYNPYLIYLKSDFE